jgi:hypothetical protein
MDLYFCTQVITSCLIFIHFLAFTSISLFHSLINTQSLYLLTNLRNYTQIQALVRVMVIIVHQQEMLNTCLTVYKRHENNIILQSYKVYNIKLSLWKCYYQDNHLNYDIDILKKKEKKSKHSKPLACRFFPPLIIISFPVDVLLWPWL